MNNLKFTIMLLAVVDLHSSILISGNADENPITRFVRKTLIVTARGCMSHVNATESDLEFLRKDPPFPEKSACIVKCLMEKIGIVKNSKYSKTGFMAAVGPLVVRNKKKMEHMRSVADSCDKEITYQAESPCQVANEVARCIFKYAPELHFKS